ncbi:amino acid ABC transporter permease [Salinibacillus aidingensis]
MMEINITEFDVSNLFDPKLAIDSLPFVLGGLPMTIAVSFVAMGIGLILGLFLALGRNSKTILLRWPVRLYISFMRGTPIIVFLFILYNGLPYAGIELSAYMAAIIGFGLNSAAYIAEINRASLNSVPSGQWESAQALGLTKWKTLGSIILPQATRIALPPLTNVFLDLVKASSLAAVITVPELFQKAQIVGGRTYDHMTMYVLIALIYWSLCIVISAFQERLEKRFSRYIQT